MNNMDNETDALYEGYNYRLEESGDNYKVYYLKGSVYPGVDILVSSDMNDSDFTAIKQKYSEAGYATSKVVYKDIKNLEDFLFIKFFKPNIAKKKFKFQYDSYTQKIMEQYASDSGVTPKYEYIEVGFNWLHQFKHKNGTKKIVDQLEELMTSNGARLIIVEAPAGFGKTSTAYEILKRLSEKDTPQRPFFMELGKDRDAPNFRYLLLSQIDRDFEEQFKHDFVIANIKNGRIPLIIDGFDELLSKDIDEGQKVVKFEKVETMLSTLSHLLTNQSKIILTTRKTAIFSGNQFLDWSQKQEDDGRHFVIDIFQLHDPTIEEWISEERQRLLPALIKKIINPVLLSYLRYSSIEELKDSQDAQDLIDKYFNSLYKRERERQELPLKVSEQKSVFQTLAAWFAGCDITADARSEIKDIFTTYCESIISDYVTKNLDERTLANKLTNHALLDRKESGKVGFINDFVFGNLLAESFLGLEFTREMINTLSVSIADKLIEAAMVWNSEKRCNLANKLLALSGLNTEVLFAIDRFLFSKILRKYDGLRFSNEVFESLSFDEEGIIINSTFTDCKFTGCDENFILGFKDCIFSNCEFDNNLNLEIGNNYFYPTIYAKQVDICEEEKEIPRNEQIDLDILKLFLRRGANEFRIRYISNIIESLKSDYDRKTLEKHIGRMESEGKIFTDGNLAWILQPGSKYYNSLINK